MKNKKNLIPIIGIALLAVVFVSNALAPRPAVPTPKPTAAPQQTQQPVVIYYTEGEIVDALEKNLEKNYPGRWDLSRRLVSGRTLVEVVILADTVGELRDLAAAGFANMPDEWEKLVSATITSSKNWHEAFTMNQIDDVFVSISFADSSAPEEPCFTAINGILTYDPVRGVDLMADIDAALAEAAEGSP